METTTFTENQEKLRECLLRLREFLGKPVNEPFRLYLENQLEDTKTRLCRESDMRVISVYQGQAQVYMALLKDLYPKN